MSPRFDFFTFDKFITSIYILRKSFPFPKIISSIIIFLNVTQNLSYLIQLELENYSKNSFYTFVWILVRPFEVIIKLLYIEQKYWFLVCLVLYFIEIIGLSTFNYAFSRKQNYEQFINKAINYFPTRVSCYLLNFLIQIGSNIIFNQMIYLSFDSLSVQLNEEYSIASLLIISNILAFIIQLVISISFLLINENLISNQIFGVERVQITFLTFLYIILTFIQPISALFLEQNQKKYLLLILQITIQITLIIDTYFNQVYILLHQRLAQILSMAINLSFTLTLLIQSTQDIKSFLQYFVYSFFPIFLILKCKCNFAEKKIILSLFRENQDLRLLKFGLMKLLNKDTNYDNQDIFYKILIGQWHQQKCISKTCTYCKHENIQNSENMCCITVGMYQSFIDSQLQKFLQLQKMNKIQLKSHKHQLLTYAFFLFDFGWIVKSTKILDFLYQELISQINNNENKIQQNNQPIKYNLTQVGLNITADELYHIQISWLEFQKIKHIIQEGKQKMRYNLFGSSLNANQQSFIQEFVNEHLHHEMLIKYYENLILQLLDLKQKFFVDLKYINLSDRKTINRNSKILEFFTLAHNVQTEFLKQQQTQMNCKVQQLQCFFWGEIIQDFRIASNIKKISVAPEKELNKLKKISHSNVSSQIFSYIILEVCDNLQNFKILTHSQNFYQYYGQSNLQKREFLDLMPDFIGINHNSIIKQFFETGKNKYYYNFQMNFLINPLNLLTYVQMFHAQTTLFNNNNMTFAVYLQESTSQTSLIIIDQITLQCNFTKNLLTQIGWSEIEIECSAQQSYFDKFSISNIYPDFKSIIENETIFQQHRVEVMLNLPYLQTSQDEIYIVTYTFPNTENDKKKLYFQKYKCEISLERKFMDTYQYFVLTIYKINSKSTSSTKLSIVPKMPQINSACNIQTTDECQVGFENDSPNIGQLNSLNYLLTQKQASIIQNPVPLLIQVDSNFMQNNTQNVNLINSNRQETLLQSDQIGLTQRNSQLLNTQNFQMNIPLNVSNVQHSDNLEQKKEQFKKRKTIVNQNNIINYNFDDVIKKREDLIKRIHSLKPKHVLQEFQLLQLIIVIMMITFIYIEFTLLKQDFQSLMGGIYMTSIYSAIMGPHDLYFSMKATISGYQQMNREGFISKEELYDLTEPYYLNIGLGFEEIKNSLFAQINNQMLRHFLDDISIDFNFMNLNDQNIISTNISFRDALFVILQYQFQYENRISQRGQTNGSPFQVSIYSNYFQLHQKCNELSQDIYNYSLELFSQLQQKWIIYQITFNSLFLIIFIIKFFKIFKFIEKVNLFLEPISFIDDVTIHHEIRRQSELLKDVQQNINIINFYNPDKKLQQIMSQESNSQYQRCKYQQKDIKYSLVKYLNIFTLLFFLLIIFTFTLLSVIIQQQFFSRFENTSNLNLLLQQMKFRPGNLFLYREIFFRWSNFTYLTQDNKNYLYSLVDKGYYVIDDYIQVYNNIDFDNYLVDENFINIYEQVNSQNFCDQIDQTFRNLTFKYCSLAFEGTIEYGMISTLKYISNQMKAQQQINNFTKRVEYQLYEQEGSQIVSRLFFMLMNQFEISLEIRFQNLNVLINVLTITYSILLLIIIILVITIYHPYLKNTFEIMKFSINIIPLEIFLYNKAFERKLSQLKYNLQ